VQQRKASNVTNRGLVAPVIVFENFHLTFIYLNYGLEHVN